MVLENKINRPSEMHDLDGVEYFLFEEDFVEANVRCIPMIVRFKMDAAGIKLALAVWCKFSVDERKTLALMPCKTSIDVLAYHDYLNKLVKKYTGADATKLKIDPNPLWADVENVPEALQQKAREFNWAIAINKWKQLSDLQRFALLKLFSPGHENKNFPKAMVEFGLASNTID